MKNSLLLVAIVLALVSCKDKEDDCQTCTKTTGGVAGNFTEEVREVCDDEKVKELEESSAGTSIWTCEEN